MGSGHMKILTCQNQGPQRPNTRGLLSTAASCERQELTQGQLPPPGCRLRQALCTAARFGIAFDAEGYSYRQEGCCSGTPVRVGSAPFNS